MRVRRSLRYKLPLLISTLLCLVVGVLGWSAYRQLETVLLQAAGKRLTDVTRQLAGMLEQSLQRTARDAGVLGANPVFIRSFAEPTDASRQAAEQLLEQTRDREHAQLSARAPQPLSFALWTRDGRRLVAVGPLTPAMARRPGLALESRPLRGSARIGPLTPTDSGVAYEVVAAVAAPEGDTLGFLVVYRIVSGQGVSQINDLIGSDATFIVGNAGGGVWTDLTKAVDGPPLPSRLDAPIRFVSATGDGQIGVADAVRSTPWLVWVEIPTRSLLAPARAFLSRLAAGTVVLILFGSLGAWLLSRQFTAPLADITLAAEDVARGDYARRVATTRDDELGSLAQSFNTMAAQVQAAAGRLHGQTAALKAANVEMRESERRYRQLVEFSPDAVIVHRDRQILFVNPAALALYGASSPEQVVGRLMLDFVPPEDRAEWDAQLHRSQVEQRPLPFSERRVRQLDGTERSVEAASTPFILDGRPSVLTILRDITARKRLEDQARQGQKMEAVGQLAGGIAHDFNNVLMAIRSYSQFVLDSFDTHDARRADVEEILKASTRATTLTRQLLAFSRQQMLQPRVLDLNVTVGELAPMLGRLVGADMQLETRLDAALGAVHVDPGQVEQVLVNLVVNARDAMPEGGAITVQTSNVDLAAGCGGHNAELTAGRYVVLTVSDSGCGMDRATQARIFEPFFTTKDVGQGTGLGLSTVYGIVKQSGGCISVYSEPGEGTTFKVYLPRVDEEPERAEPADAARPARAPGTGTVLLVEDEPAVRSVMRRILARAGYTVLEARNGAEAITLLELARTPVDLVLTDLVMPEMGGRALATELTTRWPEVRLVFVSGFTRDAATRRHVLEPGAGFLEKPFTSDTLVSSVEAALGLVTSRV